MLVLANVARKRLFYEALGRSHSHLDYSMAKIGQAYLKGKIRPYATGILIVTRFYLASAYLLCIC